jgi:tRNA A-37 threonylcarbamoyl transferase component Bud32
VLGREERSADLLFRAARFLAFRRAEDEVSFRSRRSQVEHEASVATLARVRGVRAPEVLAAGRPPDGPAFLLEEAVAGHPLGDDPGDVTALVQVWAQVRTLHEAAIAHRDLRRHNVVVADDGAAWLVNFSTAQVPAPPVLMARDVADLLVSIASHTGQETVPLEQVTRVRPRTVLALVALGFAVHLLLPQVGNFHQTWQACNMPAGCGSSSRPSRPPSPT